MQTLTDNIFTTIKSYENDYFRKPVQIVDGYYFDQYKILRKAYLYQNNRFEDGQSDEYGEKVFAQIIKPRINNGIKNTDIDVKDIGIHAINGADYMKSWIYRRSAQNWMREHRFGSFLNQIPVDAFSFGTVVVKKVPTKELVEFVDLRNLINDPTAKCLEDSWVIEDHYYTPTELLQYKGKWENIDLAIESFRTNRKQDYVSPIKPNVTFGESQYIRVREFKGHVPASWITENPNETEYVKSQFVVIMPDESESPTNAVAKEGKVGLILFKAKVKDFGYKEVHVARAKGRWLGVGWYEELADMQYLKNKEINQIDLAMRIASLIIFQTGDQTAARNILKNLKNGDILKFAKDAVGLSRVNTQITDNGTNQFISNEIEKMANDLANSYEVTTGATLPSGTPYQLGALLDRNANKLFDFIREQFGLFVKDVFESWVLPELEKEMTKAHILEITNEDEVRMLHDAAVKYNTWEAIKKYMMAKGTPPTVAEIESAQQIIEATLGGRKSVYLDIPVGFLKHDKKIEVRVTDEEQSAAQLQTKAAMASLVHQDPSLLQNKAFLGVLDDYGLSVADLSTGAVTPTVAPGAVPGQAQTTQPMPAFQSGAIPKAAVTTQ